MVERQAMRDAPAAIVSHHSELLISEAGHQFHLVQSHGAFGIFNVVIAAGWFAAVPISTQIRGHDGIFFSEHRSDDAPFDMRLRIPVQQKERRPVSRGDKMNGSAGGFYGVVL